MELHGVVDKEERIIMSLDEYIKIEIQEANELSGQGHL